MRAALDFLGNGADRRADDHELALVAAAFIEVPKRASDLGGFAQRLVKILEVKDGGALVRGDEVQRGARRVSAGFGFLAIAMHSLG